MSIDKNKPIILIFVGMPGAGKSSCIDHVLSIHQDLPPVLYFGGITVDEVKRRGLEVNEANEKTVREDIRSKEGADSHAKRISSKIDSYAADGHDRMVADGLYSWTEYKFFKNKYGDNAVIVAITAPRKMRHDRLAQRPTRPLTKSEVSTREHAEIENLEKGGPIANADYTIVNSKSHNALFTQLDEVLEEVNF
jgi:dephospho-CoA kinase